MVFGRVLWRTPSKGMGSGITPANVNGTRLLFNAWRREISRPRHSDDGLVAFTQRLQACKLVGQSQCRATPPSLTHIRRAIGRPLQFETSRCTLIKPLDQLGSMHTDVGCGSRRPTRNRTIAPISGLWLIQ
jgi:hypothetical protein